MPTTIDTPLDRLAARRSKGKPIDARAMVQGTCLVLIEAAGFAASTLLIVLGLPLFVFLFLAGWDLTLLFRAAR